MTYGDVVQDPDGTSVILVGVGTSVIAENERVRVWDVVLDPEATHPWHRHDNPYVVLSVAGSSGRMDWLDGSEPRQIVEYSGGAVFRPISPIHRLTNTGGTRYRNRLVELKDLGENRAGGVVNVESGARSVMGEAPADLAATSDGREPVLAAGYVRIWTITVPAQRETSLDLEDIDHVIAELDPDLEGEALAGSVQVSPGGAVDLINNTSAARTWFVVALDYRGDDPRMEKENDD